RVMAMRQREQELGPAEVAELRPLVSQRLDDEPGGIHDGLVFGRVDRADRVDDRSAWPDSFCGGTQERKLEVGKRLGAPAQVGSRRKHTEAGAGSVDEGAVEAGQIGGQVERVCAD